MTDISDEAVEAVARTRYERYDSHFSMPGGLSWEQYVADDPEGADALYRDDARADLAAALPLLTADAIAAERERIAAAIEALHACAACTNRNRAARIARAGG